MAFVGNLAANRKPFVGKEEDGCFLGRFLIFDPCFRIILTSRRTSFLLSTTQHVNEVLTELISN
jgi:hypothetical protein